MGKTVPRRAQVIVPIEKIADFCRRWGVVEFALFGSVLRDDFRADSDVDVLTGRSPVLLPAPGETLTVDVGSLLGANLSGTVFYDVDLDLETGKVVGLF